MNAPATSEYVPAEHCVQVAAFTKAHDPALQVRHVPEPAVDQVPGKQPWQTLAEAATYVEYVPASQLVHAVDNCAPAVSEYEPALHLRHDSELVAATVDE